MEFPREKIFQWITISFSRGSSQSRDSTWVSCIADRFFTEPQGSPSLFKLQKKKKKLVFSSLKLEGFFLPETQIYVLKLTIQIMVKSFAEQLFSR